MSLVFKPVPSPMLFTIVPMIAQAKIWTLTIPSPQSPFIFLLHFKPYKAKIMPFFFLSFFFFWLRSCAWDSVGIWHIMVSERIVPEFVFTLETFLMNL